MRVFILAGGFGTRLREVISDIPKPMAPIGRKPFLEFLISYLEKQGYRDIVLLTGYKSQIIEGHFGDGKKYGVNITYSREKNPLGTGGAIREAALLYPSEEDFLILNGDTFFDGDYRLLAGFHKSRGSLVTIALKYKIDVTRYGSVELEKGRIISFNEKPSKPEDGLINGGVTVLSNKSLPFFKEGPHSLEKDVLPRIVDNKAVCGLPFGGKFIDIGIPEDYLKASKDLPGWLSGKKIKAAFLDRDGIINEDEGYTYRIEDLRLVEGAVQFLKDLENLGFRLIIVTNQAGIGKGLFGEKDYLLFQDKLVQILAADGISILDSFYSPYHNEAPLKKYRKNSLLRKPGPGMALCAADKYNIDLAESVMIGDRDSDRLDLPYLHSFIIKGKYGNDPALRTYSNFNEVLEAIKNGW